MTVERGEVFGLLGPNGAGKTTVVKLLLGLARPSGGGGRVLGAPLGDLATRRRIGYLPELFRYQPWLRAREVLALHCDLARLPRADWRRSDRHGPRARRPGRPRRATASATFSKGMQQRLGLGVALLGAPTLVVLDEPTSALDPVGRDDVRAIIRERPRTRHGGLPQLAPADARSSASATGWRSSTTAGSSRQGRLVDVLGEPARPRASRPAWRRRPSPRSSAVRTASSRRRLAGRPSRSTRAASRTSSRRSSRPAGGSTRSTPDGARSRSASWPCSRTEPATGDGAATP